MKKIITPAVQEVSERVCDVTGKPAIAKLVMWFGFGSPRDGEVLEVDLSAETGEEVLQLLQSKYPQFKTEDRFESMMTGHRCPHGPL